MKLKRTLILAALMATTGYVGMAAAASPTTDFDAKIHIDDSCDATVATVNDMDFGTKTFSDTNVASSTVISVKCTTGASYNIGLTADSGGTGSRAMSGTGTDIPYEMYQEVGHTNVWGDTVGNNTVSGTGDGTTQTKTVYGLVASIPATSTQGDYNDNVTVTVTY